MWLLTTVSSNILWRQNINTQLTEVHVPIRVEEKLDYFQNWSRGFIWTVFARVSSNSIINSNNESHSGIKFLDLFSFALGSGCRPFIKSWHVIRSRYFNTVWYLLAQDRVWLYKADEQWNESDPVVCNVSRCCPTIPPFELKSNLGGSIFTSS